jgi:hypothetical protein
MANPFVRSAGSLHQAAGVVKYTQEQIDRLTLQTLLRSTPSEILDRSFTVRLLARHYETGSMDGFRRTYYKYPSYYNQVRIYSASSPAAGGSGKKHRSLIRFYGPPGPKTPCWVWCDCAYFTYYLEVLLANKDTSSVKNSNGEPPTEVYKRKPWKTGTPVIHLCKHLVRASEYALKLKKDLAAIRVEKEMGGGEAEVEKEASVKTGRALPPREAIFKSFGR